METKYYLIIFVTIVVSIIILYLSLKGNNNNNKIDKSDSQPTVPKPPPIAKNKWLHQGDDFGMMEPGISDPYFPVRKKKT